MHGGVGCCERKTWFQRVFRFYATAKAFTEDLHNFLSATRETPPMALRAIAPVRPTGKTRFSPKYKVIVETHNRSVVEIKWRGSDKKEYFFCLRVVDEKERSELNDFLRQLPRPC